MTFEKALESYIYNKTIVKCGFKFLERVRLPTGYYQEIGGYYTEFDNGYKIVFSGASLGGTAIQEAIIVDPNGQPVAHDTEDLRYSVAETRNK